MIRQILESINEARRRAPDGVKPGPIYDIEDWLEQNGWEKGDSWVNEKEDNYSGYDDYRYQEWYGPYEGVVIVIIEDDDYSESKYGRFIEKIIIQIHNVLAAGQDMPLLPAKDRGWTSYETVDDPTLKGLRKALDHQIEMYDLKPSARKLT